MLRIFRSTQHKYVMCPIEDMGNGTWKVTCIKTGGLKYFKLERKGSKLWNSNTTFYIK